MDDPDVVMVGAGADGPAAADRLAREHGLDVLILEGGAWHGNRQWDSPHSDPGGVVSSDPDDLSGSLLDEQFSGLENDANDPTAGYLRVGPADHSRAPWFRNIPQNTFLWQVTGVGGTSLHYFGNSPRGLPIAWNEQPHWPFDYEELVPYFQLNEEVSNVQQAPMTGKEEVFIEGVTGLGYPLIDTLNVTETGWRPQPNAIDEPPEELDSDFDGSFSFDDGFEGDPLAADHFQGSPTPVDAPVREKARKSTNISWVPRALDTNTEDDSGNVAIRPNAMVTDVLTNEGAGNLEATGVEFRDTWSGETETVEADVTCLAAGCIETPRLWLNSGLPDDGWVGRGLTTHWFDWVVGGYSDETVEEIKGGVDGIQTDSNMDPWIGQNSAVRFDKPGVGGLEDIGLTAGLSSFAHYLFSQGGNDFDTETNPDEPWDSRGYTVGRDLKEKMANYRNTKTLLIITDDLPRQENGVSIDETFADEHGPVPLIEWAPHPDDDAKRDELARIAANIHQEAGADWVHRCDWPPLLLHMQSSMRMGEVLDEGAEAFNVDRLFITDHSALANGVGGPNPTNSGQALALRTADQIAERYFDSTTTI